MQSIYLDNAATSFPKPAGVSDSMKQYLDCVGATINRSVYGRAQEAGLETLALRESLARLFRFPEPATHVVLTPGATFGLNLVIKGLLRPGRPLHRQRDGAQRRHAAAAAARGRGI